MHSTPFTGKIKATAAHLVPLFAALLGTVVTLAAIYHINPRFFFTDDRQAQYFPYGLIIKDLLLHGHFPLLTTRTFFGGALWLDLQTGIYNPVSLLMTLLIDPTHLEISGLVYAIIMNLLLTGGGYTLGRAYGLRPPFAALLGLMTGINICTLYLYSGDWHPGATSTAWMLFAWAAMKRLVGTPAPVCPLILQSAVFIYLSVSAGWPHTDVALAVVMAVLFFEEFAKSRRNAFRLVWAGALGVALCLPVVVPAAVALPWTARASGFVAHGLFTPSFVDLLNFSNPAWQPPLTIFFADQHMAFPFFFMAWYALPLLLLVDLRRIKLPRELLFIAAGFIFLSTSAAQLGPLRFPMRWLPDVQLGLLLTLFVIVDDRKILTTPRRMLLALGALAVTTLISIINNAHHAMNALNLVLMIAVWILLLPEVAARKTWLPAFLGASSIVTLLLIVFMFPAMFEDLGKRNATPPAAAAAADRVDYTLYSGSFNGPPNKQDEAEYLPSAMGVYYGIDVINGYSSLAHKNWESFFGCTGYESARCPFPLKPLTAHDKETGATYFDLIKVGTVVAEKGLASHMAEAALPRWTRRETANAVRFSRPAANSLPGTVSWHSKNLSLDGPTRLEPDGEELTVANEGASSGLITFARLYFPGFRAVLNDKELNVRPIDDLIVGVDVPPQAKGTLRLTFLPPFFMPCLILALGALVLWAAGAFFERRGRLKI